MQPWKKSAILADLTARAKAKRISRRTFMEGAMATGATAAGAMTLWGTQVAAQTPQRGGTFKVGVHNGNTSDTLDPGLALSVSEIQLGHCARSFLTEISNTNELTSDLALSWSAEPGAKVWRFELTPDVSFHSGKKLTSEDVIASLNHHRGEDTTSAAKALLEDVVDIRADGDNAIIIELGTGSADLPYLLTDYHLQICPANPDGSIDWQSGDGTGPYKLLNFDPGVSAALERNDDWFREGAWFDSVEMIILNDANARQTALIAGDVHATTNTELKTAALLQNAPGVTVDNVPSTSHVTLPMFCDTAPFDDVNVRLALKYAINRQELVNRSLFGYGSVGNDHPIGPSMPYYAEIEQREYDPDKAKFHLKEAGLDTLNVDLSVSDVVTPGAVDMMVLYSEFARAAGININPVREPADGYWSNVWLVKPFVYVQWGGRPTPDGMFSLAYKDDAAWNESHWQNARFNELLLAAKAELDDDLRADMYAEMQLLCRDDGGTIVPLFVNRVSGRREEVAHSGNISSVWELDGARAYQRWWFA